MGSNCRWLVPLALASVSLAPPGALAGSLVVRWDHQQPQLFSELAHCDKLAKALIDNPPAVLDREKDRFVLHYSGIGIEERWLIDPITCRAVGIRLSFESVYLSLPGEPPPDESEQAELLRQAKLAPPPSEQAPRVVEAAELRWEEDDGDWQELAERQRQSMEVVQDASGSSARCTFKGPASLWTPQIVVHGPQKPIWSPIPPLPPDFWLPGPPEPSRDQHLIKPFFLAPNFSCPCL
ncbi:MAG: hypothetical protein HY901_17275 [Deltaproteobacteria bacterium]|nr:hypothetical protein [Deltaproteobacteria bacterium]